MSAITEITFSIEYEEEGGVFVATWGDPKWGGISTQGSTLDELQANVREAMLCHFDEREAPVSLRLHFLSDPILTTA